MAITLDEDERWTLLESNDILRFATVAPNGTPHITPIWYLPDRNEEAIYLSTPADSRKVKNVRSNPNVSLTVDEGDDDYFGLRAVIVEGTASFVEDDAEWDDVERRWCERYFEQPQRPDHWDTLYQGKSWEWVKVTPEKWISWDNSQIDVEKLKQVRG